MKKRLIALLMMSTAILVGCTVDQVKDSTDKFVEDVKDMKLTGNSKISSELKEELVTEREYILNKIADSLDLKGERELVENDNLNELKEELKKYQSKLKYKVEKVEMSSDKKKAEAVVNIEYFDIGELAKTSLNDVLDRNVFKTNMSNEVSTEDFLDEVFVTMSESLAKWNDEDYSSIKNAKLSIIELNGEWVIDEIDDEVLNAITLGVHSSLHDGLKEKLETIKDNKKFLIIESNLLTAFNEIEKNIEDNAGIDFFILESNKDNLVSSISKRIDRTVLWGKEGSQDETYYIYKDVEKNEVVVKVNVDGEEYKLSKELVVD